MEIRSNSFDPAHRPFPQGDITRPNRETIERGTPEPIDADDVRAHLARHKHEALEKAKRAKAARAEHETDEKAQRATAARGKHELAENADRIRLARARAQGGDEQSPESARDPVEIRSGPARQAEQARSAQEGLIAQRAHAARERYEAQETHERAMAARDKLSLSDTTLRLQAEVAPAESARGERIAELRALHQTGALNTDELIARAAFKLLSGE